MLPSGGRAREADDDAWLVQMARSGELKRRARGRGRVHGVGWRGERGEGSKEGARGQEQAAAKEAGNRQSANWDVRGTALLLSVLSGEVRPNDIFHVGTFPSRVS